MSLSQTKPAEPKDQFLCSLQAFKIDSVAHGLGFYAEISCTLGLFTLTIINLMSGLIPTIFKTTIFPMKKKDEG